MKRLCRLQRILYGIAGGGITLGILQAFQEVRFADIIAAILAQFFSALVALLFGGAADTFMA